MKRENKKTEKIVKSENKNLKVKLIPMLTVLIALIVVAVILGVQTVRTQSGTITAELAKARTYEQVEEGDEIVEEAPNVRFDAFFLRDLNNDGYAESIRGTCKEIGAEDTLYMELNVQTAGYLKDGKITINGENFYLQTALPKDDELKDNYIGNNIKTIELNDIANGTQKMLTGIVRSGDYSYSSRKADAIGKNINNYSKVNSVTLTGTYVGEDGSQTEISKTVEFNVDWYGTTTATIYTTNQSQNIENTINEANKEISLNFTVYTEETDKELILSKNHIEGEIPTLNDYAPIRVEYTGSNAVFEYNAETRTFRIDREAVVGENGEVSTSLSRSNNYGIRVVYPLEAYQTLGTETVTIKIPVKTYYEGHNNPSEEFTNPYRSNTATATIVASYEKPQGSVSRFDVTVGKRVYDPTTRYIVSKEKPLRLYNGVSEGETQDYYTVLWQAYIGTGSNLPGIIMKETKNGETQVTDTFIKTDASEESTDDVVSNVGIYFSGADRVLGARGYIHVYDEDTGNLLVTFTANDWNKYTSRNPYQYELPVKHIRVETSNVIADESYLYVYNVKEIDDDKITEKYERPAFDTLQYIKSTLAGYLGESYINTDTHQANYEAPISVAEVSISKNTLSTQTTEKNDRITIDAVANTSANQVAWQNGMFLVKLPEEIIDAQINNVEINNNKVTLESYELIEQEGSLFIKIVTKNATPLSYSIDIDVDLTPDPRIATVNRTIELYASNENGTDYYYKAKDQYDVNNNLNTEENVNYDTASISMVSPNSLLTNQTASDYDDKGSEVVSPQIADIKPVYAVVDQEQEEQTVKIGVQIRNNYASTISEIQILGKIPFEGNTYVLSGGDLGSTFTTKMTNAGIEIPQELQQYATVYYSENENPTNDLNEASNGWKTADQVTNWDNIKTYLINLGDYVMPTGQEYIFNYTVKIPNGLEFNKVAYSHHGVYFCLDTDEGKYRTQTEPNRLGLRIAEKYNLALTKFQTGKDKLVSGATYSITEIIKGENGEERGESKTGVTNAQGMLNITNLYAEKEYEIKEIKTPDDYELNEEVIRFIGHVDEKGTLSVEITSGTPRGEVTVSKEAEENYKVGINVEDEAKASLKIVKQEQGTQTPIQGVRFKITGYGLAETGRTVTTNRNGEANISGLSINQEYTLEEVRVPEGYYSVSPIKFTIVNENGSYTVNFTEGAEGITSSQITEEDSLPTLNVNIENEKIPTYSMQLVKVERTTESTVSTDELMAKAETNFADTEVEYLAGAKFKLYKGTEEVGQYITDETGTVTIEGLYQYEEEKGIDQTYTLKEVLAPAGYAKVKDIVFEVEEVEGTLVLRETNEEGQEAESTRYTAEGNTIKLVVEDSPSFKLIKKDEETKEVLAGIKFAIYNVDDGTEQLARNSKGEIIGTKEVIDGKEYYVVETDEKGELTADLPEGLYKAVEVEAPEKYELAGQTYYFGIGASREAPTTIGATQATSIGGSNEDQINSVAGTSDGGYIVGGYFESSSITAGDYTLTNANAGSYDGMVIKYSSDGTVEWASSIGGGDDEQIYSVAGTSDGGYIVGGYFESDSITVGDDTLTNNSTISWGSDGMVIKYSSIGEVEWARSIGGGDDDTINSVTEISDGGYIVGGAFKSNSITVGDDTLTNSGGLYSAGMIIKYRSDGEAEWATSIGRNNSIRSVAGTSDGGYIIGGSFRSSITVGDDTLTNAGPYSTYDGMVIKYRSNGEAEWARSIGGTDNDYIYSVSQTSDEGYIVGGYFRSDSITVGDDTLTNANEDYSNGMVIKYSSSGEVEWARSMGGNREDIINSVAGTSDGGGIVVGYFKSDSITVGNYNLTNASSGLRFDDEDGMVIKYRSNGEVEWATSIGGRSYDSINSVAGTSDGGYIVGGYFANYSITVGDYTLSKAGFYDGMVIKLGKIELNNHVTLQAQSVGGNRDEEITSVAKTSDGGYIVGGYFVSNSITVGDYTLTNNSRSGDGDGMVIKYTSKGEVEWARSIGGWFDDTIRSLTETSDGGYIVVGYFDSDITIGDYTLTNVGSNDGMVIKYSSSGEVEWARSIGGTKNDYINSVAETKDGRYIVGGYFYSDSITIGDYTLTNAGSSDGMVIKCNSNGEVEWATNIGGTENDYINSVAETKDGGYIVGGYFYSDSITVGNYTLTNTSYNEQYICTDGMVIKYSSNGEVEWARSIGGGDDDYINSVTEISDGGYIVGGYFVSSSISIGDYTLINANREYHADGIVIKYSSNGEVKWATSIGENGNDYIESVTETKDGGYIVGGYFESPSITVGNYTLINVNAGHYDGMVIKCNSSGKVEWAKDIGGSDGDNLQIVGDRIQSVTETNNGEYIAVGYFESDSIETDGNTLTNAGSSDGMILKIVNKIGVPEVQELTVENSRKEFQITTDVEEIDGVKGGSISGEDKNPYETVKYGDSSKNEMKMTPEAGYEIIKITINGKELLDYEVDADGSCLLPQFTNVTEDKHIVVTYARTSNKITIVKQDEEGTRLQGAKFKLDQIEDRVEPENVIGEIVANGGIYTETKVDISNEVTDQVKGKLTNNGTYYFIQNEDGTLVPTNSKTYQSANDGSTGIQSTTANSYIEIDLSGLEGEYAVVVNANVSSESADYGYATITQTTNAPSYSSSNGRIFRISGTSTSSTTATDYTSMLLEGGNTYYLHLGYRKDSSVDTGDDQIVINSIKVYGTENVEKTYNFVSNGQGGYESNNQGKASTTANSYIPIDLRNLTGKYNLVVNANVSSQSGDYGYATITQNTNAPSYSSNGRIFRISGTSTSSITPTDYTTVLQGGSMYYLHLGYYKNASTDEGEDKFTVNSIKVTLNSSELYPTVELVTNEKGEAVTDVPYGRYSITELQAPEGYETIEEPITIEFRQERNTVVENNNSVEVTVGENGEFLVENKEAAKVIVHHYLKTEAGEYTTTKVAEDDYMEGKIGEEYITKPHLDIENYELEKDTRGNYITPKNATGKYVEELTEVIYYYEESKIPLIVHHYIEGTEDKVPLASGGLAEDQISEGTKGERYVTEAIDVDKLDERYELITVPSNAQGTYEGPFVEVIYYYREQTEESIKRVTVTKIWNNTNGIYKIPEKIKVQVKNEDKIIAEQIISADNATQENVWTWTFTGLPKYNEQGEEIQYTIDEVEVNAGDLKYYKKDINGTTITNTYNGPVIHSTKEMTTENSLSYVVEGEKIIYTIRVQNSGDLAGDVVVKDSIPEGTSFVAGSIKVNGVADASKTETDLRDGMRVTVPARTDENTPGETTVSFEVTVNTLEGEALTKQIANTATINKNPDNPESPEEPTNEVTTVVNKSDLKYSKSSNPETGSTVKVGDEITYTIHLDNSKGTAPTSAIVKDTIPTGTTFVKDSIVVGGQAQVGKTTDDLANGIKVDLAAGESKDVVFKVTVNDLNNEDTIRNVATIKENPDNQASPEEPTNETEHTYAEAIITANKEMTTENRLSYVLEGEKITYTIRVQNSGDLGQEVVVKDNIPEGTSFVAGSVKVNGVADETKTETDLKDGMRVTVPARTDENTPGETTVSFEVTVNELEGEALTKQIANTATINKNPDNPESPEEPTNEVTTVVNKSDLKYNKSANPVTGSTIKVGEEITYTIHLDNSKGTAPTSAIVKDSIPTGTTFVKDSIVVGGQAQVGKTADDLASGIQVDLAAGESKDVVFKVTVNDLNNGDTIRNMATIKENPDKPDSTEEPTNETEHTYAEAIITANKEMTTENGLSYVLEGEKITYTIKVQNSGDLAGDVVVKDSIPEGTSFVAGSIKVNGVEEETKTETDLRDGMRVTVPARTDENTPGETTVSFEVTVNELEGEALTKQIANTATVNKNPDNPDSTDEPTNEVTTVVNKSDLKYNKSANPVTGSTVKVEDEITYTIHLDNSKGTAPTSTIVKDTIPTGTTFVKDSIVVGGQAQVGKTTDDLANGIKVDLAAGESKDVVFKVTVNDLDNGATIKNVATVKENPDNPDSTEEPTNETEHTYAEAIMTANKEMTTENSLSYVIEGEKIIYTIRVQNSGDLAGDVVVKDNIPEGTSFVAGSIKVNGVADASKTETDLENGMRVTVPARTDENTPGETTVSFEVTVNELEGEALTKQIANTATINKNPDNPDSTDEPTNEVTTVVNKSDLKYNKSANPVTGSTIKVGEEITYTIHLDNSKGTAPTSAIVKDSIPTGTTFVEGSIQINGIVDESKTADDLASGIKVDLPAGESKDVVFKVTVNDLNNGNTIRNVATIKENPDNPASPEEPTNETEHTYAEAVIHSTKEITTENGLSYVLEGEKITYTIKVQNSGDLAGDVVVKDSIPEGTSFVARSIKVNGVEDETKTETDLENGMRVTVPARTNEDTPGEATVSFTVKVNAVGTDETSKTIRNTGYINKTPDIPENPDEPTNEVAVPVLMYKKKAEIVRTQGNEEVPEGSVTAGDRIKYTITIHNVGTEKIEGVEIKDNVPEGTTIYQINDDGEISLNAGNVITWNVAEIAGGEVKEVSFEVTVNYDNEEKTIKNVATVDGKETNEVETPYVEPKLELESSIVKDGTERVTSAEEKVSYTIKYTANIQDFVGKAKVKIVDYLPYTIDTANSELDGGNYDEETKTITWEVNFGNIDTYQNAEGIQTVEITKSVLLKYNYPDAETLSGSIDNTAEGTITLTQRKEPEGTEQTVKEETVEDKHEVKVEIPAEVIVHHYIYDEAKGGETTQKVPSKEGGVVADEKIEGIVGERYDTNPSQKIDENYECINVEPEKAEGNMTKEPIEVTYYYELKTAELGATIEKTATASKQEERKYETGEYDQEGNPITETKIVEVLTEEDGVVTYKIKYRAGIKNYKGTAKISIVDKLPAALKEEDPRVNLTGGTYNSADRTITWEQEVEVNTFETGSMYDETIEKEIKVVYQDQNVVETLVNEVTGSITIYYPENHSTNPGGERDTNTVTDTAEVEQEYKVEKQVEKVWDDNEDTKGNRPESVTVQLTAGGNTNYNGEELEKVVLNEENNWKHTFTNLPKYTEFGQEIQYSVVETETNEGDLEYYEEPVITIANEKILVTNSYKLMETDLESSIEKTGTEKITAPKEPVTYDISYKASITDYIGEVVVKVVDTLPYKLATNETGELLEQINLAGGTYHEETNTITWEEKVEHVNTYTDGDYKVNIQKEITLVYSNLDATQRNMTNQVTGTVDLYETGETNTVEDTHDTSIEIPGKVIVKYVDKETGKEITYLEEQEGQEPVEKTYGYEIEGFVGDAYTTEQKEIPEYTYVENSGNTEGNMIEGSIEVIYYYEKTTAGGVIVHYEDEEGNKLLEDEIIGGKVGDSYTTEQKEIEDYEYVRVEGEPQGELTEGVIEVTYIYRKTPAKVIVKHLEKDNTEDNSDNKELYPEEVIEGHVGDSYTTSRKTITNYRAAEPEPSNKEGKMTKEDTYVIYYYEKIPSGTVTAKYVDIETKEEILYKEEETGEYKTYREQMKGYVGENYQTEAKEIPYYNLVENLIPTNKEGKYTQEDIEVTYYYRKQEFNMTIDKIIKQIEKDGKQEEGIDEKLDKIEIVGSKIEKTNLKITYGIKVSNTGEIEGTATVVENIPSNFQVEEGTASEWKQNEEGNLEAEVALKPGETKELTVVLSWMPGDNHFGTKRNTAEIIKTDNPAKYEEVETKDNKSEAEMVITIKTGETTRRIVFIIAVTGMIAAVAVFWYLTEKYNRDNVN